MGVITWCVANWRIITSVLLVAGSFVTGWTNGSDHVQRQWDVDIHVRTKAALEQVKSNDNLKTKLEEVKNVNTKTVEMLATTIRTLRADNRLHLYPPTCPGGLPDTVSTGGSKDGAASTGELSRDVPSAAENALNRFDAAYASEAERADKLIESCRVLVDWARAVP